MTIEKELNGQTTTLKFDGWLDVTTTPELHSYLETLEPTGHLVFDFRNLEYISSSGVREVVASYRKQKDADGSFSVINVNPEVYDVFNMTGLDKKIDIQPEGEA